MAAEEAAHFDLVRETEYWKLYAAVWALAWLGGMPGLTLGSWPVALKHRIPFRISHQKGACREWAWWAAPGRRPMLKPWCRPITWPSSSPTRTTSPARAKESPGARIPPLLR